MTLEYGPSAAAIWYWVTSNKAMKAKHKAERLRLVISHSFNQMLKDKLIASTQKPDLTLSKSYSRSIKLPLINSEGIS